MGRITTHVLDTAKGHPAAGILIELFRVSAPEQLIASATTNADGRCGAPLLEGDALTAGEYQLVFHAGEYLNTAAVSDAEPRFLNQIVIRFGVSNTEQHYHVPLLLSPFGYSTYRGS